MPGDNGEETIDEQLTRKRTELVRARKTIARHEDNGQSFSLRGKAVTQIAYESALKRERKLERDIAALEARLRGDRVGVAEFETKMP